MEPFMNEDFLLQNEVAKRLYHTYAENCPIIDYHCHLSAREIYEDRPAENLTQLWLAEDHYKWRAMRGNGISEREITGDAGDYEKFLAYARTLPFAIGNPIYHWTHLELQRYFDIRDTLNPRTAPAIWEETCRQLADGKHTPQYFIRRSNVYALCTTEDPIDTLEYHHRLAREKSLETRILPAFRPDSVLSIEKVSWRSYITSLAEAANQPIRSWSELTQALAKRMDAFDAAGCVASDHGLEAMPYRPVGVAHADAILRKALLGQPPDAAEQEAYKTELMLWLGRQYARRGWAMELHLNALRSANTLAVERLGEASGYDTVADNRLAYKLAAFLNALESSGELPKTILFSLNDADNLMIASMLGSFQSDAVPSKIQMGTAWWFQDNIDGMERQMRALANEGVFGRFIGMLTDSRSFLSYPRHEYFRRILCSLLGKWVESGQYPDDMETLGMLVEHICWLNAKAYFGL